MSDKPEPAKVVPLRPARSPRELLTHMLSAPDNDQIDVLLVAGEYKSGKFFWGASRQTEGALALVVMRLQHAVVEKLELDEEGWLDDEEPEAPE